MMILLAFGKSTGKISKIKKLYVPAKPIIKNTHEHLMRFLSLINFCSPLAQSFCNHHHLINFNATPDPFMIC